VNEGQPRRARGEKSSLSNIPGATSGVEASAYRNTTSRGGFGRRPSIWVQGSLFAPGRPVFGVSTHLSAAIFDYLAQLCRERQNAWDCACGTGQATLALAERFKTVIATDASPQQLAAAPAHANVTYRTARAEESGIESNSVDLVTVRRPCTGSTWILSMAKCNACSKLPVC